MTMFVTSQSFISLPSFMFVSAAVSEIHDLNQNKKFQNAIYHLSHAYITQYGSTVYIGMAMGCSAL